MTEAQTFREVLIVDINSIKPYENNPRINKDAVEGLAKVIEANGFLVPIVVDANHVIITGHTRLLAMQQLGYTEAQIIVADHLTPEQVKAFRLADNRVSENSKWDESKLSEELRQLADMGFDLAFTGFSEEELNCLCGTITADCLDDLDYASVCGAVAPSTISEKSTVVISIGTYKLKLSIPDYKIWEAELLKKYPKQSEALAYLAGQLSLTRTVDGLVFKGDLAQPALPENLNVVEAEQEAGESADA